MTAPGATAPQPGRAGTVGRPAGALLVLLLVGLLALLPCAGRAQAVTAKPEPTPVTTVTLAVPVPHTAASHTTAAPIAALRLAVRYPGAPAAASPGTGASPLGAAAHDTTAHALHGLPVDGGLPLTWCSVDGDHPMPGSGCSSHPFCGQESQLPNAPPQPAAAVPTHSVAPEALPRPAPFVALVGPDHAPDLHVLQVHRS
ncbi:hypothetical protein [Saccharothrix sp. ST-888]|uniref:hypothetical protein n=1 Tax=Saccharothrix sp. ST-888 TaxID=1427391 RepID=UPI0005ECF991|nr:hypothetical protein [Saccharothrix sp. ST-888]KJK59238.1 hypothetical protein UK12_05180 [Saccharothrix sp. ST-888]